MNFAYPWVLPLVGLPLLLLAYQWRAPRQQVVLPLDRATGKDGRRGGEGWRARWLGRLLGAVEALPLLLLVIAVVMLAGPQQLAEPRSQRVMTNIEFCVDVSGSMVSSFGDGTRYDAAMGAINEFIDYREGDAFGLTIFGSSVMNWVPLTTDASAFKCAHPFLDPMVMPNWFGGGTRIALGLDSCLNTLASRDKGDRMVILVSDGYSWDLANGNDAAIAAKLREHNIVVYAIHIADGDPPDELYTVAQGTGGEVFAAGDPEALAAVFKRVDAMQPTKMEKTSAEIQDDFFALCCAGLAVLGLYALSLLGLRATPW